MPSYLEVFSRDRICGNVSKEEFNGLTGSTFPGTECATGYNLEDRLSLIEANQNILLNNEYKVTYFQTISISGTTSGTIQIPQGATIEENEFGDSGNSVLSTLSNSSKPTFETPQTSGGTNITANLNTDGTYNASNLFSDPVALIYVVTIKAKDLENLNEDNVLDYFSTINDTILINFETEEFIIDSNIISNGFVDLENKALEESVFIWLGGSPLQTPNSYSGSTNILDNSRITFSNDLLSSFTTGQSLYIRYATNLTLSNSEEKYLFNNYLINFEPSTEVVVSGGSVLQYDSYSETVYRFIPDPYVFNNDAFYRNFDGTNVTNLIIARK